MFLGDHLLCYGGSRSQRLGSYHSHKRALYLAGVFGACLENVMINSSYYGRLLSNLRLFASGEEGGMLVRSWMLMKWNLLTISGLHDSSREKWSWNLLWVDLYLRYRLEACSANMGSICRWRSNGRLLSFNNYWFADHGWHSSEHLSLNGSLYLLLKHILIRNVRLHKHVFNTFILCLMIWMFPWVEEVKRHTISCCRLHNARSSQLLKLFF